MSIILPNAFKAVIKEVILKNISSPLVYESVCSKFTLAIHENWFVLRTNADKKEFFNVLKFDAITADAFSEALLMCYITHDTEVTVPYRVKFEILKIDPAHPMKRVLDYDFWVGGNNGSLWISFEIQGYGTVKFYLPEIE